MSSGRACCLDWLAFLCLHWHRCIQKRRVDCGLAAEVGESFHWVPLVVDLSHSGRGKPVGLLGLFRVATLWPIWVFGAFLVLQVLLLGSWVALKILHGSKFPQYFSASHLLVILLYLECSWTPLEWQRCCFLHHQSCLHHSGIWIWQLYIGERGTEEAGAGSSCVLLLSWVGSVLSAV